MGKKDSNNPERSAAHFVVSSLLAPLYDKGHVVHMDSFLSSQFFCERADHQAAACSTPLGVFQPVKDAKPTAGDPPTIVRDGCILYIAWYDNRPVHVMRSAHNALTFRKEVRSNHHQNNV